MTTEDFVRAVDKMNTSQEAPAIANFGLNQSSHQAQRNSENAYKNVKQKDYMVEVKNAKRLIAKYAREDREAWQ